MWLDKNYVSGPLRLPNTYSTDYWGFQQSSVMPTPKHETFMNGFKGWNSDMSSGLFPMDTHQTPYATYKHSKKFSEGYGKYKPFPGTFKIKKSLGKFIHLAERTAYPLNDGLDKGIYLKPPKFDSSFDKPRVDENPIHFRAIEVKFNDDKKYPPDFTVNPFGPEQSEFVNTGQPLPLSPEEQHDTIFGHNVGPEQNTLDLTSNVNFQPIPVNPIGTQNEIDGNSIAPSHSSFDVFPGDITSPPVTSPEGNQNEIFGIGVDPNQITVHSSNGNSGNPGIPSGHADTVVGTNAGPTEVNVPVSFEPIPDLSPTFRTGGHEGHGGVGFETATDNLLVPLVNTDTNHGGIGIGSGGTTGIGLHVPTFNVDVASAGGGFEWTPGLEIPSGNTNQGGIDIGSGGTQGLPVNIPTLNIGVASQAGGGGEWAPGLEIPTGNTIDTSFDLLNGDQTFDLSLFPLDIPANEIALDLHNGMHIDTLGSQLSTINIPSIGNTLLTDQSAPESVGLFALNHHQPSFQNGPAHVSTSGDIGNMVLLNTGIEVMPVLHTGTLHQPITPPIHTIGFGDAMVAANNNGIVVNTNGFPISSTTDIVVVSHSSASSSQSSSHNTNSSTSIDIANSQNAEEDSGDSVSGQSDANGSPLPYMRYLESFGPGPYGNCRIPARVVCGAKHQWRGVFGMNDWCRRNCVVYMYSTYCDDERCMCVCTAS